MSNRKIINRTVYKISVITASPVCVSGTHYMSDLTDSDVIKDYDGNAFIPGSSIAGALRDYRGQKKDVIGLFGFNKDDEDGQMSAIYISDLTFGNKQTLAVRDSVKLSDRKTAEDGAKFDIQVLDTGAKGVFFIETVSRENDSFDVDSDTKHLLSALCENEICFGSKKTRGFGKVRICNIESTVYSKDNYQEYINAYDDKVFSENANNLEEYSLKDKKYIEIMVPLKMRGGISIRKYAVQKGEPDFEHITANGMPVIPGSSIAGAIRHRMKDILVEQGYKNIDEGVFKELFGFVANDREGAKKDAARISQVIFEEAIITDATPLIATRNAVSRFEAATKDGALYKEKTYVNGKTNVTIRVKKQEKNEEEQWIGLLLLAIKDLANGYLAIGGQTAIGRGLFKLRDGECITVGGSSELNRYKFRLD